MSRPTLEDRVASGEMKRLGCLCCRIINYVWTGEPEVCELCDLPLKTIEECERRIPAINKVLFPDKPLT